MASSGIQITGAQILYLIYRSFDKFEDLQGQYTSIDLWELRQRPPNDQSLQSWQTSWDLVLLGQNDRPSDASLLDVYRAALENVPSMALYLELFEQKLRADPTRNYQILHDTVEARL